MVMVMQRPWSLVKGSGSVPILVSEFLPGIIPFSSKVVK
jgi:hypothetical protein